MDYQALNQNLAQLLSQFDLNQKVGGCSLVIFHQGKPVTQLAHGVANIDKTNQQITLGSHLPIAEFFDRQGNTGYVDSYFSESKPFSV